jgi:hypothetical protein
MLDTYIKNRGTTKTIIHNNNHNTINETNWDADYDGNVANVSLDLSKNGRNKHMDFKLTNDDLANLLTVPSVSQPIHKRLKMDFVKPESFKQVFLELDPESSSSSSLDFDNIFNDTTLNGSSLNNNGKQVSNPIQELLTHLSSPNTNEEFVMPFQNNSLDSFKPVIKIVNKSSKSNKSNRHSKRSKSSKSSKRSKRHKHHNYPSTRKSPRRRHTSTFKKG